MADEPLVARRDEADERAPAHAHASPRAAPSRRGARGRRTRSAGCRAGRAGCGSCCAPRSSASSEARTRFSSSATCAWSASSSSRRRSTARFASRSAWLTSRIRATTVSGATAWSAASSVAFQTWRCCERSSSAVSRAVSRSVRSWSEPANCSRASSQVFSSSSSATSEVGSVASDFARRARSSSWADCSGRALSISTISGTGAASSPSLRALRSVSSPCSATCGSGTGAMGGASAAGAGAGGGRLLRARRRGGGEEDGERERADQEAAPRAAKPLA